MVRLGSLVAAVLLWCAQSPQPTFRAGVDLVPLHVSVVSRDGQPVPELKVEDFEVLDRGKPASIAAFAPQAVSIALQVVLDDCPRMAPHELAARGFAERLFRLL